MRKRNVHIQFWLNEKEAENFIAMMKELHYIGVTLNQISQKAHVLNVIDTKRFDEAVALLNKAVVDIVNAVMLPRKMERSEAQP